MHNFQIRVPFQFCDPAGILFFARIPELAHMAYEEATRHSEPGWEAWFDNPEMALPLKRVEADFLRPIRAGEMLEIEVHCDQVKDSDFKLSFELLVDQQKRAHVDTYHVCVNRSTFKRMQLPEWTSVLLKSGFKNDKK